MNQGSRTTEHEHEDRQVGVQSTITENAARKLRTEERGLRTLRTAVCGLCSRSACHPWSVFSSFSVPSVRGLHSVLNPLEENIQGTLLPDDSGE